MEKIDWIEAQAINRMKEQDANWQLVSGRALNLLLLLLAGGGGSVAMAVQHAHHAPMFIAVACWLFFVAVFVALRFFKSEPYPVIYNTPNNLLSDMNKEWPLERLRWAEINGMQRRIDERNAINNAKHAVVDVAIKAVCLTPLIVFAFWQG